ncbi:MAG TPA: hypothetical protein VKR58_04415, partial [Aquella sp.]|nr:hypothetical protein [Aquella sp.]
MDFATLTLDARIAIQKLETYGLSCLSPCIKRLKPNPIYNKDIRIYSEPTTWQEIGAINELVSQSATKWTFQLNLIPYDNQFVKAGDILIGFIMLPKQHQNISVTDEKITASFYTYEVCISTFEFEPFKFVPAIENTYFISVASYHHKPFIVFNKSINYEIYCLVAFLQRSERYYCSETPTLTIPITNDYAQIYVSGMNGYSFRQDQL